MSYTHYKECVPIDIVDAASSKDVRYFMGRAEYDVRTLECAFFLYNVQEALAQRLMENSGAFHIAFGGDPEEYLIEKVIRYPSTQHTMCLVAHVPAKRFLPKPAPPPEPEPEPKNIPTRYSNPGIGGDTVWDMPRRDPGDGGLLTPEQREELRGW